MKTASPYFSRSTLYSTSIRKAALEKIAQAAGLWAWKEKAKPEAKEEVF